MAVYEFLSGKAQGYHHRSSENGNGEIGERRVNCGARVALGADKTVAPLHVGVMGINVHFLKIQDSQQLHNGQGAADMAHAHMTDAGDDIAADILADLF